MHYQSKPVMFYCYCFLVVFHRVSFLTSTSTLLAESYLKVRNSEQVNARMEKTDSGDYVFQIC